MRLPWFLVWSICAVAQAPELRREIEPELRTIYDTAKTRVFLLLSSCPPGLKHCDLTGYYAGETLARIVVLGWEDRGRRAIEYYFRGGALIHIYESFEYVAEAAPADAWKNFKGLPAWERRVYFRGGEAGHVEGSGTASAPIAAGAARELAALLIGRAPAAVPPVR